MIFNRNSGTRRARVAARPPLLVILLLLAAMLAGCSHAEPGAQSRFTYDPAVASSPPNRPDLSLKDDDRILILSPHPDDEILATGGLVQQALAKGLPVKVVFLTNGDNNEFAFLYFSKAFTLDASSAVYAGQVRALEALRAGRQLGLNTSDETFLGYPDFGTLEIWQNRWGPDREAFRSMFSERNQVPYWFAATPDAPYKGESILQDLKETIADFKPTKVFVSHGADTNPDHAALNLFARTVLLDLKDRVRPEVYAFLTHYGEWPQRGLYFDAPLEPPAQFDEPGRWLKLPLEAGQVRHKLEALKQHKTQYGASKAYLESYMRANELFDPVKDIRLVPGGEGVLLLPSGTGVAAGSALPAGATGGGAERRVRVEGDELIFSVAVDQASSSDVGTEFDAFGYRSDRPFGEMPKIHVAASASGHSVTERRQALPADSVTVQRRPGQIEVRVPLALLGNPEKLFLTATANTGGATLDRVPWILLDLGAAR